MPEERLQKLMARAGYGSRRACEEIIKQGRVTVNGEVATLGMRADPQRDDIRVDGERLRLPEALVYVMLHKPRGVISDEDVKGNWPRARDLIPIEGHLYPVGRLDVRSEGLMLFTNDGDLAHKLTHPSYEHPKTYHVLVAGSPTEKALDAWRRGILLEGKRTLPAEVRKLRKTRDGTLLEVTMHEGRKRQIRRIAAALGYPALRIVRIRLGPLELGDLPPGGWRLLTEEEVAALQAVRKAPPGRRRPRSGASGGRKNAPRSQSGKRSTRTSKRGTRRR
ncbi:MAG TPA: rRNA pseudouridine synthase [Chloroflexi bacterium]|nr:rRNA pseudouridine synthase [Chloroflexota bacterium]